MPKLTVTAAAPPVAHIAVATYGKVEMWTRNILIPHYMEPDVDHRQKFREFYIAPYTPYLGAYGCTLTIETDALLR